MAVLPTGILSIPVERLAELVASSTTFQAKTGTVSEATALPFVFRPVKDEPHSGAFAVVQEMAFGVKSNFGAFASGVLILQFWDEVTEVAQQDAWYDFGNFVGAVIKDVINESRKGGRLLIREGIDQVGSIRAKRTEESDYFFKEFNVPYGITAA